MKLQFDPTIDYVREGVAMLQYFCSTDADKTLVEIMRKNDPLIHFSKEDLELMAGYDRFLAHVRQQLALSEDELKLLEHDYTHEEGETDVRASVLFPCYHASGMTLEEVIARIESLDEGTLRAYFLTLTLNIETIEDGASVSINEFMQYVLDAPAWTAQYRCHILNTFLDYHASFAKATPILARLIKVIQESESMIRKDLDEWAEQTLIHMNKDTDSPFLTRLSTIIPIIEEKDLTMIVRPTIATPASVVIFMYVVDGDTGLFGSRSNCSINVGLGFYKMDTNLTKRSDHLTDEELQQALKTIADKSKFDILTILRDEHCYAAQLANRLSLSPATISYHMSALVSRQLVSVGMGSEEKKLYYQLNTGRIKKIAESLLSTFVR
ncbi:MAG: winged helix-turn-helix transcriptional regulator [Clostridiales bacterium]|nr:winged helix-turn-helix transcriptional regulator [Clostridiales bacterium]